MEAKGGPPRNHGVRAGDPNASVIDIPEKIYDTSRKILYKRGRLLGKGGFARCYEVTDTTNQGIFACKIVNKQLLVKPHQREKMSQEIQIHRDLKHEFVVDFVSYFEDDLNVYIILELCSMKSLMELQKRRRMITEPEARYFLRQIVLAIKYLHEEKHIIHRDLKLGNIFITENMQLKLGDFGLATEITTEGERKKTLCGTPNYIAPEVLSKKGHSYEVDIWSLGCILYTMLIGKPPFETTSLRDTYHRIRRGEYYLPPSTKISTAAKTLLAKMLQVNPALRPTAQQILMSDFFTLGYIPSTLPTSVLTMAPRFERVKDPSRVNPVQSAVMRKPLTESNKLVGVEIPTQAPSEGLNTSLESADVYTDVVELMRSLRTQLKDVITAKPSRAITDDESESPGLAPLIWISKWVDYSDKYGFGYQLSDDSIGVSFNDQSKIILLSDGRNLHYMDKTGREKYYVLEQHPIELNKKVKLLHYFNQYMKENLLKASGGRSPPEPNCIARIPCLWTWFRTSRSVVMVLNNGTMQINNFRDHSKTILCPLLGALTTLDSNRQMRTYKMSSMVQGISKEMFERIRYAVEKVDVIIGNPVLPQSHEVLSSPSKPGSDNLVK